MNFKKQLKTLLAKGQNRETYASIIEESVSNETYYNLKVFDFDSTLTNGNHYDIEPSQVFYDSFIPHLTSQLSSDLCIILTARDSAEGIYKFLKERLGSDYPECKVYAVGGNLSPELTRDAVELLHAERKGDALAKLLDVIPSRKIDVEIFDDIPENLERMKDACDIENIKCRLVLVNNGFENQRLNEYYYPKG